MVEITPTAVTPPDNDSREFHPMRGVGNRHLQTMLPRIIRRKLRFTPHWQRLELPDGDFVDLAWSEDPAARATNRGWWFFTVWKAACTALTPTV